VSPVSESRTAEIRAQAEKMRAFAHEIETAIPAIATSIDGATFSYQAPIGSSLVPPGGYVTLVDRGRHVLGQIVTQELVVREGPEIGLAIDGSGLGTEDASLGVRARVRLRVVEGEGTVLEQDAEPVVDAPLSAATPDEVRRYLAGTARTTAGLEIGTLALVDEDLPAVLEGTGFDRHTFLCGQSGSGKTYSLGVVLERLLLETSLRVVILDPNSDFVRLPEVRAGADPSLASRMSAIPGIVVRRVRSTPSDARLRLRFGELEDAARGGVLRLDPIADREEYAELQHLLGVEGIAETIARFGFEEVEAAAGSDGKALVRRSRNLGVDKWEIWARDQPGSVLEELDDEDLRVLVVDLGTLDSPRERDVVAQAVLGRLWERRHERRPVLIVVDEAHNVCPQLPEGSLQWLATDYAIRIAAEGRKFGLYLLVSSQRPQKVHENVLSQCDNLILMRMNSTADLAHLTHTFSFVPASFLARATGFRQGEALVAGKLASTPVFVRFGARITEEGGSDVPADWAAAR
jgi:DNA helicase HerA-like ATPase